MKCFVISSNVRFSSKFVRKSHMDLESPTALIRQTLDQNQQPTTNEWSALRGKLLDMKKKSNSSFNIDSIILRNCLPTQLQVGKSYIKHIKDTGCEPSTSTLINLLQLYYNASKVGTELTKDDEREIIDL